MVERRDVRAAAKAHHGRVVGVVGRDRIEGLTDGEEVRRALVGDPGKQIVRELGLAEFPGRNSHPQINHHPLVAVVVASPGRQLVCIPGVVVAREPGPVGGLKFPHHGVQGRGTDRARWIQQAHAHRLDDRAVHVARARVELLQGLRDGAIRRLKPRQQPSAQRLRVGTPGLRLGFLPNVVGEGRGGAKPPGGSNGRIGPGPLLSEPVVLPDRTVRQDQSRAGIDKGSQEPRNLVSQLLPADLHEGPVAGGPHVVVEGPEEETGPVELEVEVPSPQCVALLDAKAVVATQGDGVGLYGEASELAVGAVAVRVGVELIAQRFAGLALHPGVGHPHHCVRAIPGPCVGPLARRQARQYASRGLVLHDAWERAEGAVSRLAVRRQPLP